MGRRLRTLLTKRFLRPLVLLGDKAFLKQLNEDHLSATGPFADTPGFAMF